MPDAGSIRPARHARREDLPAPLGPTIAVIRPGSSVAETSLSRPGSVSPAAVRFPPLGGSAVFKSLTTPRPAP